MQIIPIKTPLILPGNNLEEIILTSVNKVKERSIIVISSKIVSICENSIVNLSDSSKDKLTKEHSQYYLNRTASAYNCMFTITKNSLMLSAGIDESNSDGNFVLWPKNPLQTAKSIHYLITQKLNIRDFGVIIADSTSKPFRLGTTGLSLAHWGFKELNNYIGNNDLFGRTITVSKANVAEGIASAGVLVMGEGSEQTPLALATQLDFVKFNNKYGGTCYNNAPNSYTKDLYEPFWKAVKWNKGEDN